MGRRPVHQRLGPRLQPRVLLDQAVWLDAFEEHVALQERRIGGIDQGIFGAVEERAAALLVERLFEPLERLRRLLGRLVVVGLGGGVSRAGHRAGKGRHVVSPGTVDGALDRVLRMQPRLDRLIEILVDRVRLEQ